MSAPLPPCVSCGHQLRVNGARPADHPGTRVHHGRGLCSTCHMRQRRGVDALPPVLVLPGAWVEEALCAQTDPEEFFPPKGRSPREAKKVCAACPVAAECLAYALDNGERHGVWGGLSERERRSLPRKEAS